MGLPALYYSGRDNPPHPEIWINYFLRMVKLYSGKVCDLQMASNEEDVAASLSFLKGKEKELLRLLITDYRGEFTPIEVSRKLSVTNKTIINRLAVLVKNGFVVPILVNQRIRSYELSKFTRDNEEEIIKENSHVLDLVLPVVVLIASCIVAMIYTGGFFTGASFVEAFANSSASVGLVLGGSVTLAFTFVYYMMRDVLSFREFTECIPDGFKSMIAPIMILTLAWTLSGVTNLLGAKVFVANMVQHFAQGLQGFLPMVIFVVAAFLAFATGTSWGTFSILIPIVIGVFPSGQMMAISIASCLAGAVCGDHCSPISDTTIMASAGGHCEHVNHVATQLPYVGLVAAVCMIGYFIIGVLQAVGLTQFSLLALPVCIVLLVAVLFVIRAKTGGKEEI